MGYILEIAGTRYETIYATMHERYMMDISCVYMREIWYRYEPGDDREMRGLWALMRWI